MPDQGRRVVFEGCVNFRDVGGLPTHDGRAVRRGRLFRSDSLHGMTSGDLVRLHDELGVRTVVDLRMDDEIAEHGPRPGHFREGVQTLRRPLFTAFEPAWSEPMGWATERERAARYVEFAERGAAMLVTIARELADTTTLPAVVHCHSGRDRTGVVVAVLLDILGVPRDVIGDDYAVTGRYVTDFELSPDRVVLMLEQLEERHGSVVGLLEPHGMSDHDVVALRAALLG